MANKTFKSLTPQGLDTTYKVPATAPEYAATNTYAVGDLAVYQGVLYKCTTAIDTPEAWTVQHWQDTTIGDEVSTLKESISNFGYQKINLFDKNNVVNGYLNGTGGINSSDAYKTSDYINIEGYESIIFSYTNFGGFYTDASPSGLIAPLNTSEMNSLAIDKKAVVPEGAKYLRVSIQTSNLDLVQVGRFVTRKNYVPYDAYTLNDFVYIDKSAIKIAIDGTGDYTSITEALYNHISDAVSIEVFPGTYNIIEEYKAFFGEETFINMSSSSNLNGFQIGIVLRNKKIRFHTGAFVICDWQTSGRAEAKSTFFSPFRVDYNVEIDGLQLNCNGTYYGIHDDYGLENVPFEVKYINCTIIASNLFQNNCIGGGCKKYSKHILKNCYFANGQSDESDLVLACCVRYHNTNYSNAVPEIYISNCFFETNFNACYYGSQTTKMKVYVNNCFAPKGINKVRESSTMNVDNVDLYTWNNQTA